MWPGPQQAQDPAVCLTAAHACIHANKKIKFRAWLSGSSKHGAAGGEGISHHLDVTMQDALRVDVAEAVQQLPEDSHHLGVVDRPRHDRPRDLRRLRKVAVPQPIVQVVLA